MAATFEPADTVYEDLIKNIISGVIEDTKGLRTGIKRTDIANISVVLKIISNVI